MGRTEKPCYSGARFKTSPYAFDGNYRSALVMIMFQLVLHSELWRVIEFKKKTPLRREPANYSNINEGPVFD